MNNPIKLSQLNSSSQLKDIIVDKLFKKPIHQIQTHIQKQQSKSDIINELRQENIDLKNIVNDLKQKKYELEQQLQIQQNQQIEEEKQEQVSFEKQQNQIQEEMTVEEQSIHLAFMLQQQDEIEFQNRLTQMQNNVDLDLMSYEQLQELEEKMGFVSRGLLQNQIQLLLQQCKINKQINDCCTICLEDSANPVEIQLECKHVFHQECISEWLSREKHCPLCKCEINLRKFQ